MADQEHNEYISMDAVAGIDSDIITINIEGGITVTITNSFDDGSTDNTVVFTDPDVDFYAFVIDKFLNQVQLLDNSTWNVIYAARIVYDLTIPFKKRDTDIRILSSTRPIIWGSSSLDLPVVFYSRNDELPARFYAMRPFLNELDHRRSIVMENPTKNDDANENQNEIGTDNSSVKITIDKNSSETVTVTTSFNHTIT